MGVKVKRRVIQIAGSTQLVSLPRKWAIKQGIAKGDEIDVIEDGDKIVISTNAKEESKRIDIDLTKIKKSQGDFIWFFLPLLHKAGYDEIEILLDTPESMQRIQKRIESMLLGYEIIEQDDRKCLIKNVSGPLPSEFDNILRRTFLVTIHMAKKGLEILNTGDKKNLKELLVLEQTNNKLTNFCQRIINSKQSDKGRETFYYMIIWLLECIGDDYKNLVEYIVNHVDTKFQASKKFLELFGEINKLFEMYYELFYNFSFEKIVEIRAHRKESKANLYAFIKASKSKDEVILATFLLDINQRIDDFLGSTAGLHY